MLRTELEKRPEGKRSPALSRNDVLMFTNMAGPSPDYEDVAVPDFEFPTIFLNSTPHHVNARVTPPIIEVSCIITNHQERILLVLVVVFRLPYWLPAQ